jgi:hypothetical protein
MVRRQCHAWRALVLPLIAHVIKPIALGPAQLVRIPITTYSTRLLVHLEVFMRQYNTLLPILKLLELLLASILSLGISQVTQVLF